MPVITRQWLPHDCVADHIHGGLQMWQYNLCLRLCVLRHCHGDVEGRESVPARDGDFQGAHRPDALEFRVVFPSNTRNSAAWSPQLPRPSTMRVVCVHRLQKYPLCAEDAKSRIEWKNWKNSAPRLQNRRQTDALSEEAAVLHVDIPEYRSHAEHGQIRVIRAHEAPPRGP